MGLRVTIESLGSPQKSFYEVRDELLAEGKNFDASLRFISYNELSLCALGPAGAAMCKLKLVQEEKALRRERFLVMGDEELRTMKNFLVIEQMWDDVIQERAYRLLPQFGGLNERQKLWLTLNCIYNHVDDPHPRGGEAMILLRFCSVAGSIPPEVTISLTSRLKDLLRLYPLRIEDYTFRDRINTLADAVLQFIPEEERKAIENEEVQGYSCTSDCYRVLLP